MSLDADQLFEETPLNAMNSLDIGQTLWDLFQYFSRFLPLDRLTIGVIDKRQISVHYMAEANAKGGRIIDEYVQHSEAVVDEGLATFKDMFRIFNDSDISPYCQAMAGYFGIKETFSNMVLAIDIGGPLYGFFGLMAFGRNRYDSRHLEVLQNVDKLISNQVSHLLHHWEITLSNERLASENKELWKRLGYESGNKVVGAKLGLKEVMKNVKQVAALRSPVLLIGETGVGKEIIAKAVHEASDRAQGPMISVNCGAIPETLLESELFGYEQGAFTGATRQKKGYFERANNGTIFLDEIAELSLQAQVKLLRVLQDMKLERIGGKPDPVSQHPDYRRHQSGFAGQDQGTTFSGRSLVPPERVSDSYSASEGAQAGYSQVVETFRVAKGRGDESEGPASFRSGSDRTAAGLQLARQRAGASEHH